MSARILQGDCRQMLRALPDASVQCVVTSPPYFGLRDLGGTILDPFGGAGTVALVADRLHRDSILIELNPEYATMAERRIRGDAGMFAEVAA